MFGKKMAAKNQKIMSFALQCIAHPKNISKLKKVKEEILQANTTSVLQPMDKKIIKSLKHKRGGMKGKPPIVFFQIQCNRKLHTSLIEQMKSSFFRNERC
jgi:hypothetical protein